MVLRAVRLDDERLAEVGVGQDRCGRECEPQVVECGARLLRQRDRSVAPRAADQVRAERLHVLGVLVYEATVVVEQAEDSLQLLDGLGLWAGQDVLDVGVGGADAVRRDGVAEVSDLAHAEVALAESDGEAVLA